MASCKHYYTLNLVLSLLTLFVLTVVSVEIWLHTGWSRWHILTAIAMLFAIRWVCNTVTYPLRQIRTFLTSLRYRDVTARMPEANDPLFGDISREMNKTLHTYLTDSKNIEQQKIFNNRVTKVLTHEMRNTLSPILSLTSKVVKHGENMKEEELREYFNIIYEQIEGISGFLDSCQHITQVPDPVVKRIDISEFFSRLSVLLHREKGVCKLEFISPEKMYIDADRNLLTLALTNLVKNSLHALEGVENPEITVRATWSDGAPYIMVSDNGCGIEDKRIKHIFEPFYTSRHGGSGIGLSLAQQIMYAHGGDIKVTSRPFVNTTFMLRFANNIPG